MDRQALIEYAKSLGAYASLRSFGAPEGEETVCVFVNPIHTNEIKSYERAIFIEKRQENWFVGFSLAGRTRALKESELKDLLALWVTKPEDKVFRAVETIFSTPIQ